MSTSNGHAVDLRGVSKRYRGKIDALRGVDVQVAPGEIFGLLGPNGAGKSTLVKIMMTVVRASKATGTMLGAPVGHKPTLARVGYLPEHHRFPRYLTGRQTLEFYGALAKVDRPTRRKRTEELLDIVGMRQWATKKVSSYSKGMMQRVGIAQALINDPDLVVLDEPTDGVDPVGRRDIRDLLVDLKAKGKTIFLNSHLLSELEMVCDRVSILVQGTVSMQGSIEELTAESRRFELEFTGQPPAEMAGRISGHAITAVDTDRHRVIVPGVDAAAVQPVIDSVRGAGLSIVSLKEARESLEDLFLRAVVDPETGETLEPGAARNGGARS